jgi:citrate synthase
MNDPVTHIGTSDATSITVRGKDLVDDMIGQRSFTEMLYFLTCKRFPARGETRILDACLVTLMEHGLTPSSIIARLMIDSVPQEIQVAMAGGLMAIGSVFAGTMEGCANLILAAEKCEQDLEAFCRETLKAHRAAGTALPGFGHPIHKPDDPRTPKLFEVAQQAGTSGRYIDLLQQIGRNVDAILGKHLTINATGAIGALLLEIDMPPSVMRGIAVVSRSGGLIGHIEEEREAGSARRIWQLAQQNIPYVDEP